MTGNKKAATWFLFTTLLSIFNICTIRIFDGYNWPFYAVTANAILSLGGLAFHMHADKAARKLLVEDVITPRCPVTLVKAHPDSTVIITRALAEQIGYKG